MKKLTALAAAAAAALVALSGCVAYPNDTYRTYDQGADRDWQRHHHDRYHHHDWEDRDTRDSRARGQ